MKKEYIVIGLVIVAFLALRNRQAQAAQASPSMWQWLGFSAT